LQEKDFSLSYTPYEDYSSNKFCNEIHDPPPNIQNDSSFPTYDENPKERWKQEELVEEMNFESDDEKDFHYMKE
jgi:hypothetical protein